MQQAQAIIERVRRISPNLQRISVAVDKSQGSARAGQLFLARTTTSLDPYLREPWTPIHRDGSTLVVERPTSQIFTPGDVVSLIGPVGKPIPIRDNVRTLLLIAHEATPTALLMLAEAALFQGIAVTLALLGASVRYPLEALPPEIEVLRREDTSHWSDQSNMLQWADQIVAVAPPPFDLPFYGDLMNQIRETRVEVVPQYVYGLFQPPMPCGVGACQACLIRRDGEDVAACVEGPAFDLTTLHALKSGGSGR